MKMISREDLKQRMMWHFCGSCSVPYKDAEYLELGEYCCDTVSDTIAFIDELPTIEAQPVKHGRWMNKNGHPVSTALSCYSAKCSECELYSGMQYINKPYNYCPYCGAKMDLKEI